MQCLCPQVLEHFKDTLSTAIEDHKSMPHNFAAKFKLIVPHVVFSVINPYGPLAINVSIPLIPVYSENELYCILLPVQSRVRNHNNFSNFSVPNNGPAAPRLPYQTPEFQPIVLSPSQPTNLS